MNEQQTTTEAANPDECVVMRGRRYDFEGGIKICGYSHEVEYEPGAIAGASTLFLRVNGKKHCVPIYIKQIDEVIDMLRRGKQAIEALEN